LYYLVCVSDRRRPAGYGDRVSDTEQTQGRIYLLRHGETEWSATGRHTSFTDIPLTARGRELATASGRVLTGVRGPDAPPFALELTSPRRRAGDTAALAKLSPEVDGSLVEWNYGDYEGLTTPEIRQTVPGWTVWTHPSPNGESAAEVAARADAVLERCRPVLAERPPRLVTSDAPAPEPVAERAAGLESPLSVSGSRLVVRSNILPSEMTVTCL